MDASELTWVSLRSADGKTMIARLFNPGDQQSVEVSGGATLRVGNAGGLQVQWNGRSIGPIGSHGEVRDVTFQNGNFRISANVHP